jgi:ubiquinone biosynthesis monooxygenase Coq7
MRRLPGDPTPQQEVESMIRVDHAGEYGAMRIYAGQLAVLKNMAARQLVEHMAEQEKRHLETFEQLMRDRQVRPTVLMPLWHIAGFALGAATALMGEKAAFACTVAVESVIDRHYAIQEQKLGTEEKDLAKTIATFRKEEMEHHDTSLAQGAEDAPLYAPLTTLVKAASRLAIWLSTRL